jgi:PAS domain S-box-containing protein
MEENPTTRHHGTHMSDVTPQRRPRASAALLFLAVAGVAAAQWLMPADPRSRVLTSEAVVACACLLAALVIGVAVQKGAWRGGVWLAWSILILGAGSALLFVLDGSGPPRHSPGNNDPALLVLLLPLLGLAVAEAREHFPKHERRELGADTVLIAASLSAIFYVVLRPAGADATTSTSAAVFALLAAWQFTVAGAVALWVPTRPHVLQSVAFAALAAATMGLGWRWTHGGYVGTPAWIQVVLSLGVLALAGITVLAPRHEAVEPTEPPRWTRPVLTAIAVVTACAALALVAMFDHRRGISALQSSILVALLGLGVAVRILANQIVSTHVHRQFRAGLADKETALRDADEALERVRDTNETLRESEEHLRLVFDAAVDGVVEMDQHGVVLRTNEAFSRMVGLDRRAIEGQRWSVLAASVAGANADFALLPRAGEAEISRPEGQPLHLESRVSKIPTTPPRTLMLVRDVTAARVADQTIRSLFQYLQDRDEDRTRLMRRSNAAIESERNRVARDLHDGPVQGVSAASLSLEAALLMIKAGDIDRGLEVLSKVREELAQEADALRRLMSGLRPPVLEERGLMPALREMVSRFGTDQGVHTEFSGHLAPGLPEDLETLSYRIVQEALSNAAKHAEAAMLTVAVSSDGLQLRIEIQDDGQGFDSARAREFLREGRVGLASMRERVELASGSFIVRSSLGRGTTIMATLPVEPLPADRELAPH